MKKPKKEERSSIFLRKNFLSVHKLVENLLSIYLALLRKFNRVF